MNLNEIAEECHDISVEHGFWNEYHQDGGPSYVIWTMSRLALIHSEVSEALEAVRKDDESNLAEELADILIRVFDLAGGYGIDLDTAVTEKMEKNRNRPHMHGKLA